MRSIRFYLFSALVILFALFIIAVFVFIKFFFFFLWIFLIAMIFIVSTIIGYRIRKNIKSILRENNNTQKDNNTHPRKQRNNEIIDAQFKIKN